MAFGFTQDQWSEIRANARRWWAGELKRPLIQLRVPGRGPGRPEPALPHKARAAFYDLSVPAERIADRWDYDLSRFHCLGDAFPVQWADFGPGVMAAFMGARLNADGRTCWFHPETLQEIPDIEFRYDPDNAWLRRCKDLHRAAAERWEGRVQVSMTDLGGNLDVLSTFRPAERLLLDLYDHPDAVKRLTWEAHELWWRYFEELNGVLQPANAGYTAWAPIFSSDPYYMLQCDFCYMIGPAMFDEFVKPELEASCRRLGHAFYHLDGPGQLPHLDSLLTIQELKGVQWVPGAGAPDCAHWPEVYRKIRDAGKRIQVLGDLQALDAVVEQLGSAEGIVYVGNAKTVDEANEALRRYGVI
ncbi:MAG: hypothetical protein NTW86_16255 [Candidatus Sumerlaeota bacterium]|nr:hypothetical protein [Candidatus Sumerlaeota bacterium]